MSFIIVGASHKSSPLTLREKLYYSRKSLKNALNLLKEKDVIDSVVILFTCNRIEFYASVNDAEKGIREIVDFISGYHGITKEIIEEYFYSYRGKEAAQHLFEVCSGLDSLVIGETQILGQAINAFTKSKEINFTGHFFNQIFSRAIVCAKQIHAKTNISEGKTSIGSVTVDFIKHKIGDISKKNILVTGVGKVSGLVGKYLQKERASIIFIANRTYEKAKKLADEIDAQAVRFSELAKYIKKADIIITATSSPHYIYKEETLKYTRRDLLIIDLAVPRDVEPGVSNKKNIDLCGIEDLNLIIEKSLKKKSYEAVKAKEIISKEVEELWKEFIESEQEEALLR